MVSALNKVGAFQVRQGGLLCGIAWLAQHVITRHNR